MTHITKLIPTTFVANATPMSAAAQTQANDASIAIMKIFSATDRSLWRSLIGSIVVSCCAADAEPFESMWDTMEFCETAMYVMVGDVAGHA